MTVKPTKRGWYIYYSITLKVMTINSTKTSRSTYISGRTSLLDQSSQIFFSYTASEVIDSWSLQLRLLGSSNALLLPTEVLVLELMLGPGLKVYKPEEERETTVNIHVKNINFSKTFLLAFSEDHNFINAD